MPSVLKDKFLFALLFGALGIYGTYSGIPYNGAVANMRLMPIIIAGIYGGPFVGIVAGLIAGVHRMFVLSNRFTAIVCGVMTIVAGIYSGQYKKERILSKQLNYALAIAIVVELLQCFISLTFPSAPLEAIEIAKTLSIPNLITNCVGITVFMLVIHQMERFSFKKPIKRIFVESCVQQRVFRLFMDSEKFI